MECHFGSFGALGQVIRPIRDVKPGGQISAAELNRAFSEVEKSARILAEPPLEAIRDEMGTRLRFNRPPAFWAVLTDKAYPSGSGGDFGSGSGSGCGDTETIWYSFTQVFDNGCGEWVDISGGIDGNLTLFEANNLDVPLTTNGHPTVVRVHFAPASSKFVFDAGSCCGGLGGSGGGSGSGDGCNNMAANFEVRPPVSSLPTDLLLTSDPVNGVTVNYKLSELIDAQLLNSPANERFWPGKFHANSLYGSVLADTYAATMTFNMGVTGSNLHSVTLAGNPTLFVSGTAPGQMYGLFFKQDATGGRTIGAWFSGIIWEGAGTPAALASAAGAVTLVRFIAGAAGATHRHLDTKTWAS